jgi:hypothetical protein
MEEAAMKWMGAVVAAAIVASGCAPSAFVLRGASLTRPDDLSRCAMRQLERLGFTVQDGNAESGIIRATRNTATTRMVLFSGIDSEDRLVVTTEQAGSDGGGSMHVAGDSLFWRANAAKIVERPSADVARQANEIFEACGILDAVRVQAP